MNDKIAKNIPIWKLVLTFQEMMNQGFYLVDISVEDDFTLVLKGRKEEEDDSSDKDLPDLNQLTI